MMPKPIRCSRNSPPSFNSRSFVWRPSRGWSPGGGFPTDHPHVSAFFNRRVIQLRRFTASRRARQADETSGRPINVRTVPRDPATVLKRARPKKRCMQIRQEPNTFVWTRRLFDNLSPSRRHVRPGEKGREPRPDDTGRSVRNGSKVAEPRFLGRGAEM